ncbi:outer membrane efflux protein [Candidatus Vecturithrix granuli]|uniref:Outer membrane efflux protein n=1 Tax=Vecturithrix granuli TaxID=1499967 RepID=A0A081C7S3_VECG1|nr:outer membrane efflux protein [Candidatus Vecturithrix granuli]
MKRSLLVRLQFVLMATLLLVIISVGVGAQENLTSECTKVIRITSLEECLKLAFEQNRQRQVSRAAIARAEAQHQQALSSYWPQVTATLSASRRDEDSNFLFPEEISTYNIAGLAPLPMDVTVRVPEKDVKHLDRDLFAGSLNFLYPLYTGGKRRAVVKQAELGVHIAEESARRTDLQILYDVKRMYYGKILAARLRALGQETLERLQATQTLTEQLYQTGTGAVKKTDYLRTNMMVSTARSLVEFLRSNDDLATAALINVLGFPWDTHLELTDAEIPFIPLSAEVHDLVAEAYQFSPDWGQFELALAAAETSIQQARGGHLPTIALTGDLTYVAKTYDSGLMSDQNRNSWTVGVALELPIFTGFRTTQQVKEAQSRVEQLQHQQMLLSEGIALQIQDAFLQIDRARGQVEALQESATFATENRELNIRAYQNDLVETREVLEAQLLEAFIKGQHLKALYDHAISRALLDWLIGREVAKRL